MFYVSSSGITSRFEGIVNDMKSTAADVNRLSIAIIMMHFSH